MNLFRTVWASGIAASLVAMVFASACARQEGTEGSGGQGGVAWSSSVTTAAGEGGATLPSSTGLGGAQPSTASEVGATTTATSSAGSSGSGGASSTGQLVLLAGGSKLLVGGEFHAGAWATESFTGASDRAPSLAFVGPAFALGVHRDPLKGELQFESFDGTSWAKPKAVGPLVTTQGAPALAARGNAADVVFLGDDFKHYFGSYLGGWNPTAELVKAGLGDASFGPVPGAIAVVGQELVLAFPGGNGGLFVQSRLQGAWQLAAELPNTATTLSPAAVGLSSGAELLLVYANSSDKKLMFATRLAGAWSAAAAVEANSFSADPPALAALPNGEALLVFRGFDTKPYTARFVPGATPSWSAPKPLIVPNPTVTSAPSVAPGIGGHDAEVAYVGSDGKAYHTHLASSVWSAPVAVAGPGLLHVAIASSP